MSIRRPDRSRTTRVVDLTIGDEPEAWARAGFRVTDGGDHGRVDLGGPVLRLVGAGDGRRGILAWTIAGSLVSSPGSGPDIGDDPAAPSDPSPSTNGGVDPAPTTLDGLVTTFVRFDAHPEPIEPHPNGVTGLDHLVVATPDLDRTTGAIGRLGVPCRRVRDAGTPENPMRQGFFKFGPLTIEIVSDDRGAGADATVAPATFWGLALDTHDLDRLRDHVGADACSEARPAVQPGRRIATLRHRTLDLSVRLAALDHHARSETAGGAAAAVTDDRSGNTEPGPAQPSPSAAPRTGGIP